MSLKILQFVPEALPTFRPDVAVLFGKYLPRCGVECDVVGMNDDAPAGGQGFASMRRSGYFPSRLRREWSYLALCSRILLGVDRRHCDLIQVRDMVSIGLLAMLVARAKGIPYTYWMSYLMSEGRIGRARAELARGASLRKYMVLLKGLVERAVLYRLVLPRAHHVFVQSEAMRALMVGRGIPAERQTAVPMGVDMEALAARRPAPLRPAGWEAVPLVAYLGALDKERELHSLVDALALLRQRVPGARLLLIGASSTPADAEELRAYVACAGLADAVRFTGWMPTADAWRLLAAADAAVSYVPRGALYDVSSPTKLLEYLALGLPAVGNDTPDQAHVLGASAAGWLTASTPAALADALAAGPAYIEAARSYRVLADLLARQYRRLLRPH